MAVAEDVSAFRRIVSATRLHLPPDTETIPEATLKHLRNYVLAARRLGVVTAIAVNSHEEEVRRVGAEVAPDLEFHVLPVPCWGAFVPALNALLSFAQRTGNKYILYQSLEVQCTPTVLQYLLDFHTSDTLVVGPTFDGHVFEAGEQPLNGRTSPWNTLALWSVRKLALTGFLCIADGMPDMSPSVRENLRNPQESESLSFERGPMGSDDWWNSDGLSGRQLSALPICVPAGVEEVTAIALLQHLHGSDRTRAVLLQLPAELEAQVSWRTSWEKDERREKWHKYKMESKVSRPEAQLQELFKVRRIPRVKSAPAMTQRRPITLPACMRPRVMSTTVEEVTQEQEDPASGPLSFGVVMHYGESISAPTQIRWICLASIFLFYANTTAVLADAFRLLNAEANGSATSMAYISLLIGGVFLPMPASLWLIRTVTQRSGHRAGLLLFGACLFLAHVCIVVSQTLWPTQTVVPLLARLVQGLGSGVLFQVRFVLGSLSTSDQHMNLQSWNFLMSDLGLGVGAMLPAVTTWLAGAAELSSETPELWPSAVLALISLAFLAWVILCFPRRCPFLPDRVRFRGEKCPFPGSSSEGTTRITLWISGTTRVFVQSAILPAAALSMRDARWTGGFRQTMAVAAICLLPMPFEALASHIQCTCSSRSSRVIKDGDVGKMVSGAIGAVAMLIAGFHPCSPDGEDSDFQMVLLRICELGFLMVALAIAAPFNASRLLQQKDAERCVVLLEWMKAYIGRLLGPIFAVLFYRWAGYGPLLGVLSLATAVVTVTA